VGSLFPSEERTIMQADKARVIIRLERNLRNFGKSFVWDFLPFGKHLERRSLAKDLKGLQVTEYIQDGKEAERGDIADIIQREIIEVRPLTLTNKHLILSYKKGLKRKKNLVVAIPLEYAKSVRQGAYALGLPKKQLDIRFEVSREEENTISFDVWLLDLRDCQAWLDKLNQLVAEHAASDRLPSLK